jgi:hypothetical protein
MSLALRIGRAERLAGGSGGGDRRRTIPVWASTRYPRSWIERRGRGRDPVFFVGVPTEDADVRPHLTPAMRALLGLDDALMVFEAGGGFGPDRLGEDDR